MLAALLLAGVPSDLRQPDIKVTLLGTSNPNPVPDRFGPSTLVEAGNERLLFDCGRGATIRLWQVRVPLGTVKLFLTQLRSASWARTLGKAPSMKAMACESPRSRSGTR